MAVIGFDRQPGIGGVTSAMAFDTDHLSPEDNHHLVLNPLAVFSR